MRIEIENSEPLDADTLKMVRYRMKKESMNFNMHVMRFKPAKAARLGNGANVSNRKETKSPPQYYV